MKWFYKLIHKKFTAYYQCRKCNGELTFNQVMGSDGTCPLCGNQNMGTVVDAFKAIRKNY